INQSSQIPASAFSRQSRFSPYTRVSSFARRGIQPATASSTLSTSVNSSTTPVSQSSGTFPLLNLSGTSGTPSYASPYVQNRTRMSTATSQPLLPISSFQPSFIKPLNSFVVPSPTPTPSNEPSSSDSKALDALEDSSKATYGAGLLRFTQFCDEHDVDEEQRMPASCDLIAAFIASASGSVSGSTIKAWLSGIRAWHIFNKAPWKDDEFLSLVRTAARKVGASHKRPLRAPISLAHLGVLCNSLDVLSPKGAAVWACATTTFFGCRRLGETTVSLTSFNARLHVARGGNISFRRAEGSDVVDSITIHLPWTKTTKEEGGKVIITRRDDNLCPVFAFLNHLTTNDLPGTVIDPKLFSLFAFRQDDGRFRDMYKEDFLSEVQQVWSKYPNLDHVSGHSFLIGGAVALLMAGVEPEVVAAAGGWTSMAFLIYWRRLEEIIPKFMAKAYEGSDFSSVKARLERMRVASGIPSSVMEAAVSF
ncbi:hypothetical protein CVT24_010967, partial [Panaeolus cyanescens]